MEFFKASLWEIKTAPSLKILGGVLAAGHLIQFLFWQTTGQLPLQYAMESAPMCWPLFDSCNWIRIFPIPMLKVFLYAYAFFSLSSLFFFFFTRFTSFAFFLLVCAFVPGFLLYIQDFRLSSNPGYVLFLFTVLYMLVPGKGRLFRLFIVSYFVASGLLKLSPEWLTGSWFTQHWTIHTKLAEWLAVLSTLIELLASAALLLRDGRYFWTGWATLFAYLCALWWATGYFGPTLFLGLLIFMAAQDLETRKSDREFIYQSFIRPEPTKLWSNLLMLLFWLSLAATHLNFPGRQLFTPLSAVLTPHPVAATESCEQSTYAIYKNHSAEIEVPERAGRPETMKCSPYLRFLDIKSLCERHGSDPDFQTIASFLSIRRLRDSHFHKAFEVRDFCNPNVTFKSLGLSAWTTNVAE
jgi:hypothetical protein